ncbi:MAG TPA: ribokinase [Bacillota bacterium]
MKKIKKVIVFGSINMDLVVSVDEFPKPGETVLGKQHHWFPGGKGANQAVAIRRLGGDVCMIGKIGSDNLGEAAIVNLQREGINIQKVRRVDSLTGLAVINVNSQGENDIVVSPGANLVWDETDDELRRLLTGYSIVVLQLEIPIYVIERILKIAKEVNVFTVLNAAPVDTGIIPSLHNVDLLIVNEIELSVLSGVAITCSAMEDALQKLSVSCKNIIVTLGKDGCALWDHRIYRIPAYHVKAVDTTAAGDAFVGAVVSALSEGIDLMEASRWASAVGALTVTKLGAQASIPYRNDVLDFIKMNA